MHLRQACVQLIWLPRLACVSHWHGCRLGETAGHSSAPMRADGLHLVLVPRHQPELARVSDFFRERYSILNRIRVLFKRQERN